MFTQVVTTSREDKQTFIFKMCTTNICMALLVNVTNKLDIDYYFYLPTHNLRVKKVHLLMKKENKLSYGRSK